PSGCRCRSPCQAWNRNRSGSARLPAGSPRRPTPAGLEPQAPPPLRGPRARRRSHEPWAMSCEETARDDEDELHLAELQGRPRRPPAALIELAEDIPVSLAHNPRRAPGAPRRAVEDLLRR